MDVYIKSGVNIGNLTLGLYDLSHLRMILRSFHLTGVQRSSVAEPQASPQKLTRLRLQYSNPMERGNILEVMGVMHSLL